MYNKQFTDWFEALGTIWKKRQPEKIVDICAEKFVWHETPFSKPITDSSILIKEWKAVSKQKDISFSYELITTTDNIGVAHWNAKFTRTPSMIKVEIDGIFKITLDANGKCTEFRQWYNYR